MSVPGIILIGAGGHAKSVLAALLRANAPVIGLVDAESARHGTSVLGLPILGGDDAVLALGPDRVELVNAIGSVGVAVLRASIRRRFETLGFRFHTVIDPTAIIGPDVTLGAGAQVLAGAVIQPGCRLGAGAIVNTRASLDHDCLLGEDCHVAPGAVLSGGVVVGDRALVGTGASVRQGIHIGDETVVGAGAAVVFDLAPKVVAAGVPARPLVRSFRAT